MRFRAAPIALVSALGGCLGGCTLLFPVDGYDRGSGDDGGYAATVLADSPLAYWRLGESSGTDAIDGVGGFTGAYRGVTLGEPGAIANDPDTSARFTASDSAVVIGDVLDIVGGAAFSLEAWAKPSALDVKFRRIMTKRNDVSPAEGWSLVNSTKDFALDAEHVGAFTGGVATTPLPIDVWMHVVVAYDGTTLWFYLDGSEDSHAVTTVAMSGSSANLVLGSLSNANGNAWVGDLDEIAIYDHALPATRVMAHYAAGTRP